MEIVAVDSTGFSDRHSVYYRKRLEDFGEIRGWEKIAVIADEEGYVLWAYFGDGNESDFGHIPFLLRRKD